MNIIKLKSFLEKHRQKSYSLLFHTIEEQDKWFKTIQEDNAYESIINEIKAEAKRLVNKPLEDVTYTLFKIFEETGSRIEYERVYFEKRRRLNTFAMMSLLEPKNPIYLKELHQIIWSICDEYTWCLPAHLKGSPEMSTDESYTMARQYTIDLFAAETSFALSEILQLTKDSLDPFLRKRIMQEIYERIFWPFLNQPRFHWETATHNWASVCAGSIGSAALHLINNDEELFMILERVLRSMECYLDGFNDDGTCLEGYGYWEYGFGFFVYFADLLKKKTGDEVDLLDDKKVHQIALFQQKSFLHKNIVVNFSDARATASIFLGLSHYLNDVFIDFEIPEKELRAHYTEDNGSRWAPVFRNLYWFNSEKIGASWSSSSYFLKDSQWFISRYQAENINYGFATKGGHNDEPHNHNDIGHFILQRNGEVFLKDLGSGLYNEAYFGPERYSFLGNGSHGHSVPMINHQQQKEGRFNQAKMYHESINDGQVDLKIDMTAAYSVHGLQKIMRAFMWKKTTKPTLTLEDTFMFSEHPTSIVERFITPNFPIVEVCEGIIIQGDGRLSVKFNKDQLALEIMKLEFTNHFGDIEVVKALDFTVKNPVINCQIQFVFQFE